MESNYILVLLFVTIESMLLLIFQNDTGDIWLSYNDKNQKEVTFIADGNGWKPDADAVIALNDAFSCIREFLETYKRPVCIQWQEL